MRCVTIIPSHCQNQMVTMVNRVAIRTHQATCDSQLYFIDHDIHDDAGRANSADIQTEVEGLGGIYQYWKEPFSLTAYWNHFADSTESEYVCFATADVIFYNGWLDALISDFEQNRHLFSMHPFSYSPKWAPGPTYSHTGETMPGVIELTQPSCHVILFKRSNLFRWDENLPFHEADTDFYFYLESKGLKSGISLSSRVDHLGEQIKSHTDYPWTDDRHFLTASDTLKSKWGIK